MPESDSGTRLWGVNYELAAGENSTFGATYLKFFADEAVSPERNGLNVFNARAYTAPIESVPDLSFEFEYAAERNGDALDSNAWTLQAGYELSEVHWTPAISYRYAFFEGDDPTTPANENFDPLLLGFNDWGQWWQGEIAGEYFLSNSNLISHEVRVHVTPNDSLGTGLLFFQFKLDRPASYAPGVTANDLAFEIDWYADWKINENFSRQPARRLRRPGKGRAAGVQPHQELHLRHGLLRLQLLKGSPADSSQMPSGMSSSPRTKAAGRATKTTRPA